VAWNIWREVAECGVFLIPFFLSGGDSLLRIPLSAVIGSLVGLGFGMGIYYANMHMHNTRRLAIFAVLVLVFLSAGLFCGGCHKLEMEISSTRQVWVIHGGFWSVNRLPMTILKPFGYNDSRTVLEICCYWSWLLLAALLHYRKMKQCFNNSPETSHVATPRTADSKMDHTVAMGDSLGESTQSDAVHIDTEAMVFSRSRKTREDMDA
jgi:high-affinity Fe2+/Pb2+ permease